MRARSVRTYLAASLIVGTAALGFLACSSSSSSAGALTVSIDTNLKVPDDIDAIGISVSRVSDGKKWADESVFLKPILDSNVVFPATFVVIHGTDEPIDVRVVGFKDNVALAVRDAITTIPSDVDDVLQMDINWLDKGTVAPSIVTLDGGADSGDGGGDGGTFDAGIPRFGSLVRDMVSTCGPQTSVAGTCQDPRADPTAQEVNGKLPLYVASQAPSSVVSSSCFDVDKCFAGFSTPRSGSSGNTLDVAATMASDGTCGFPAPADTSSLNVGLRLAAGKDGWCDANGCVLPLSHDPTVGWHVASGRVVLPASICNNADGKILSVVATDSSAAGGAQCAVKERSVPACQTYPNVSDGGAPGDDGGELDATMRMSDASDDTDADASAIDAAPDPHVYSYTSDAGAPIAGMTVDAQHVYLFYAIDSSLSLMVLDQNLTPQFTQPYKLPGTSTDVVAAAAVSPFVAVTSDGQTFVYSTDPVRLDAGQQTGTAGGVYSTTPCESLSFVDLGGMKYRLIVANCGTATEQDDGTWFTFEGESLSTVGNGFDGGLSAVAYNPADQMYAAGTYDLSYMWHASYGTFDGDAAATPFAADAVFANGVESLDRPLSFAFLGSNTVAAYLVHRPPSGPGVQTYLVAARTDVTGAMVSDQNAFVLGPLAGNGPLIGLPSRVLWVAEGAIRGGTLTDAGVIESDAAPIVSGTGDASIQSLSLSNGELFWIDQTTVYRQQAAAFP